MARSARPATILRSVIEIGTFSRMPPSRSRQTVRNLFRPDLRATPALAAACSIAILSQTAIAGEWAGIVDAAQPDAADPLDARPRWELILSPTLWRPALGGDIRLPGGRTKATFERLDGADDPSLTPFPRLEARRGDLFITVSEFYFSIDERARADNAESVGGLDFAAGDRANVDFDFLSAQVAVGVRAWERVLTSESRPGEVTLGLDAYGGFRIYSADVRIAVPGAGGSAGDDGVWVEPIIGFRLSADVLRRVSFFLSIDAGAQPFGDRSSFSVDIITAIQVNPTPNLGLQFGWRQLAVDLESGSGEDTFNFDGELAGLFWSVVFRF